ncbi:hypothetical protein [Xylella fastidiosa]|uniref:hypothetical protein n=1 Tax=Xylella fastidiosa TaxID=2371 RepID=UPI000765CC40|nr:hypothetical protein [Xylella fastidiosa]ALR01518.1 hypothetical protein OY18_03910 [Xylella fastidiosa]KXB14126.1 hypothetical protein ADT29_07450 [Xylella fastidiosa]KXB18847.1 hypothetical protein ADT28_12540 [Xylella fastidiosa]MDG5822513.1 hypothetical protein [Xylella fastidiosa subsp. pauca]MDG5826006.1 hypothetical protein [Xylella fastidiosa subsp. pauca]
MSDPSNEKHHTTPPLELSNECVSNFSELIKALAAYTVAEKEKEKDAKAEKLKEGTHREAALGRLQERATGGHGDDEHC